MLTIMAEIIEENRWSSPVTETPRTPPNSPPPTPRISLTNAVYAEAARVGNVSECRYLLNRLSTKFSLSSLLLFSKSNSSCALAARPCGMA